MKRIPRIKFPQRHQYSNPSNSGSSTQIEAAVAKEEGGSILNSSKAMNPAVGGKASLQPKRTPVTDKEIEAILLGGFL